MREARQALLKGLAEAPSGMKWCQAHSDACDKALRRIWQEHAPEESLGIAIFATGGYGRRELSPYSDLDLTLFSTLGGQDDGLIRSLFRSIQTQLGEEGGLKIGYAYRTPSDFPGLDAASRTSLMDARLVAGDEDLSQALVRHLWQDFPTGDFLIAKLKERQIALEKRHDTPLVTEPHLKEGAGGLRCHQTSQWIRMALGAPLLPESDAYDWVILIRSLLHLKAGRVLDHLSHERRRQVALLLTASPQELGQRTAEAMQALHETWHDSVSLIAKSSFALTRRVSVQKGILFYDEEASISEASLASALAVQMPGVQLSKAPPLRDLGSGSEVLAALGSGISSIKAMDQAGLLAQALPEVTACRFLMPLDQVHQYTVLQHTFVVLERLESKQMPSFLSEIRSALADPSLLILAGLLHDVGKLDSSRPHSEVGAETALQVCERLGMTKPQAELVSWLVAEHLTLSRIIQVKDVQDPLVLKEAAEICGDSERLDLLTLLTWADISAVNPEALTPLTLAYLEHVWRAVRQILTEGQEQADPAGVRRRLTRSLAGSYEPQEIQSFLDSMPSHYLLATPPAEIHQHLELAKRVTAGGLEIQITDRREIEATEILISAKDRIGALRDVLGVLYSLDLRLHSLRACTTHGEDPLILDLFTVSYGRRCLPASTASRLEKHLRQVLLKETSTHQLMTASGKDPDRPQEVYSWTFRPGRPATLEVQAPRGRGLAYRMANRITELGWTILGARVGQWAGAGAATFTLLGPEGKGLSQAEADEAFGRAHV